MILIPSYTTSQNQNAASHAYAVLSLIYLENCFFLNLDNAGLRHIHGLMYIGMNLL